MQWNGGGLEGKRERWNGLQWNEEGRCSMKKGKGRRVNCGWNRDGYRKEKRKGERAALERRSAGYEKGKEECMDWDGSVNRREEKWKGRRG